MITKNIRFIKDKNMIQPSKNILYIYLENVKSTDELFSQIYTQCTFPSDFDDFNGNWNVLDEYFKDFDWDKRRKMSIVHLDIPVIERYQLETYITVLLVTIAYWERKKTKTIEAVFLERDKEKVFDLFNNNQYSKKRTDVYPVELMTTV